MPESLKIPSKNLQTKLNFACGPDYRKGWFNVDIRKDIKTDLVLDGNKYPYPFPRNHFEEINAENIIEHLNDPIKFLKELARISKKNGIIDITTTHGFSYAFISDIQHKTAFTENSFSPKLMEEYGLKNIELIKKEFIYHNKWKKLIPFKSKLKIFFIGIYEDLRFVFRKI